MELGTFTEDRQNSNTVNYLNEIKAGATNSTLREKYPTIFAQFGIDKTEKFRQDFLKAEFENKLRDVKVTYIYGKARLGKTSYIYDKYAFNEICRVTNYTTGTFEGYHNQKVLVLDEFTGKLDITFMNNLLDRLPIDLPARFTNRVGCFMEVYIISNLPINELYKKEQAETPEIYNAFMQRIHEIIRFTGVGKWEYEKKLVSGMQNK